MVNQGGRRDSQDKRRRLLEAAGEIFAQRGFKAATIQEISQRANANIASVNYHFHDKESLYREVFRFALSEMRTRYLEHLCETKEQRPAQNLRLELRRHLKTQFSGVNRPWLSMIFFREMLEPTDIFDSLVEENLKPYQEHLESLVRGVAGPEASETMVRFSAFAAVAISNYFHSVGNYIKKLYPDENFSAESNDELADLVTTFVIGGIKALRRADN